MKKSRLAAAAMALALLLSACSGKTAESSENNSAPALTDSAAAVSGEAVKLLDAADMFTKRDSRTDYGGGSIAITFGDKIECSSPNQIKVEDYSVTISKEGTYILKGNYRNGSVIIDAQNTAKIQLVLDGVEIYSADFAAIYVKQADKVFITLNPGTKNILSNGGEFSPIDSNNVDAVIYAKDDISFNGTGSLTVKAPAGNGITAKDDLVFTGGTYSIDAANHAIEGKDSVRICSGDFNISAGKDGIQSENNSDAEKGFVYISGGCFNIVSGGDAVSASGLMQIDGGEFNLVSGGGSGSVTKNSGGEFRWERPSEEKSTNTASAKGFKSGSSIAVNGGSFSIDAADDALHASVDLSISGGSFSVATGDDAFHAGELCNISGGALSAARCYEGIEGTQVNISGGDITITSTDDGINASGGLDRSGFGGFRGFGGNGEFTGASDSMINISGGIIRINADGDGIDSNGSLSVSGGEMYILGPTNNANGAIDYEFSGEITGGTVVAVGAAGMAQNFSSSVNQGSILVSTGEQKDGGTVTLYDSRGNVIVSLDCDKSFSSAVISCPKIQQGEGYKITAGDYSSEIKMDSLLYSEGGMSGMGIRPGGKNGEGFHGARPDNGRLQGDMPMGERPQGGKGGFRPQN